LKIDELSIGDWRLLRRARSFLRQSALDNRQSVNLQSAICSRK
jgi:hypothetical protein